MRLGYDGSHALSINREYSMCQKKRLTVFNARHTWLSLQKVVPNELLPKDVG